MSDLWVHRYQLVPRAPLSGVARPGPREGALLRVGSGFADVHPWPELGDAPLDEQLALLARGEVTVLTKRSLALAALDGAARERGVSLFDGLTIPASHYTLMDGDVPDGFDTVKVKSAERVSSLASHRLRIDFNGSHSRDSFVRWYASLDPSVKAAIEFIEDPVPYDEATWRALRDRLSCRLALDRGVAFEGVDVLVVKPAVQEFPETDREVVVTSYLDHPVGQFGAAYVAALHATEVSARCGLFTHVVYEMNDFAESIRAEGARLLPPEGTGIGFDAQLARLPWKKL